MRDNVIYGEFVKAALQDRLDLVRERGWEFATCDMEEYALELLAECGVDADDTPSGIIDNALINGCHGYLANYSGYENLQEAMEAYEKGELIYLNIPNESRARELIKQQETLQSQINDIENETFGEELTAEQEAELNELTAELKDVQEKLNDIYNESVYIKYL
ncbi:hypothetical protein DCO58_11825 [Helicobacter saguini]|uniref:Uncharacterized protein n=1 Tax=Helicobacter saguini TaxID=1548018 RepID=A0A347VQ99_9HELI|nr:hypothetical protein [Helicobacter saguini]MWV61023.1 hypothetical protein [Helicobacter saguini]MWV68308.1 hypothetical protein [Helicobacter saguini]MWV70227.1 hypothetical protein [Helicobacter saguini]MWV72130.1 hypothetical protein [Helicobacter saguini]TLD91633.1 hypothetical protein LS64_011615 [Helicobacter saguini]